VSARVLHVAKVAGISGSENHLLLLLPALRERGYDVRFAMLHEDEPGAAEFATRLREGGVHVEELRFHAATAPILVGRLVRLMRRHAPQIVHTHLVHADFLGLPAGGIARVPVLASTKHGFNAFRDRRAFAAADRRVAGLADLHIAISAGLARYLAEREGLDGRSFEIVHYGIVPGPQPPPPPGAPRLAVVGRLVPIKGHAILLEALAAARARVPALTLEVAGDGPLGGELRGLAEHHGVAGAVTFLGRVAPVAPVLERAELVVVPSLGEGFGMVALEAMERGRPVVASTVGGLPEIVEDGRTGLLVPTGDAAALAAALVDLASDPARAAAMGAAGRERAVTAFTQARCTDRTDALYRAALAEAPARRSRSSSQARSSANAASSASTKSHGTR